MSLSVDANVNNLAYEGAPLGLVGVNVNYLPNADVLPILWTESLCTRVTR